MDGGFIRKSGGGSYCAILSCRNWSLKKEVSFHSFPRDRERALIWIERSGRTDLLSKPYDQLSRTYKLCALHFDKSARRGAGHRGNLRKNALPTLLLPTTEQSSLQHSKEKQCVDDKLPLNVHSEPEACDSVETTQLHNSRSTSLPKTPKISDEIAPLMYNTDNSTLTIYVPVESDKFGPASKDSHFTDFVEMTDFIGGAFSDAFSPTAIESDAIESPSEDSTDVPLKFGNHGRRLTSTTVQMRMCLYLG